MEKRPLEKGVEDTGLRVEVEKWPVTQICGCGVTCQVESIVLAFGSGLEPKSGL